MIEITVKGIKKFIEHNEIALTSTHHKLSLPVIKRMYKKMVNGIKSSATKEYKWNDIEFDENDWDTDSKIQYLNERDAEYNQIDIETINDIVSE
jgi:hypothetical protein